MAAPTIWRVPNEEAHRTQNGGGGTQGRVAGYYTPKASADSGRAPPDKAKAHGACVVGRSHQVRASSAGWDAGTRGGLLHTKGISR